MIPSPNLQATKVLVLAHRVELIEQARDQILRYNPDLVCLAVMIADTLLTKALGCRR